MSPRAVFFASTSAATLLFAVIAYIQVDSRAFTSAPAVDRYADEYPPVLVDLAKEPVLLPAASEPEAGIVTLPPVVIYGAATKPTSVSGVAPREATEPCSDWRELGPAYVNDGEPSGSIRVRNLC